MKKIEYAVFMLGFAVLNFCILSNVAASPVVSQVSPVSTVDNVFGTEQFTVTGSGFGAKIQAQPVLYDLGDSVFENGHLNEHHKAFTDQQIIGRPTIDPDTLWRKASLESTTTNAIRYTRSREHRTSYQSGHYHAIGANSFLGWPTAYGGEDTPRGGKKLYLSWWFKHKFPVNRFMVFEYQNLVGDFNDGGDEWALGEEVAFSKGQSNGHVIYVDKTNSLAYMVADYFGTGSYATGGTITGLTSGAKMDILKALYNVGANKFVRVWDNTDGKHFRLSWTNMVLSANSTQDNSTSKRFFEPENQWHHLELEVDLDKQQASSYVNGKLQYFIEGIDLTQGYDSNASPTIALIGFEGKFQKYQEVDFGEIYMDNSLQRVVLSDSSTWRDATHKELQYPTFWSDDRITFNLYKGGLTKDCVYLYVVSDNGMVNENGVLLNVSDCSPANPPSAFSGKVRQDSVR